MKKIFDVLYFKDSHKGDEIFSHKHTENWEATIYFCPACGQQAVWFRRDGGDYYIGEQHICVECQSIFYLPDGINKANSKQDEQRIAQLKGS